MRHSSPWSGDLTADSPELDAGRFTQTKLSVWFGNETEGISEPAIKASALCVSIPMFGVVESLNLGT